MTEPQTKPQTLEALLRRWAELEPGRCIISRNGDFMLYDGDIALSDVGKDAGPLCNAIVQAATKEAIERRGWYWHVGSAHGGKYGADVDTKPGLVGHRGYADTPAAALLSAYLQALRAQA